MVPRLYLDWICPNTSHVKQLHMVRYNVNRELLEYKAQSSSAAITLQEIICPGFWGTVPKLD